MPIRYNEDGEPYIDPGKLSELVTFLAPVTGTDASGAAVTWAISDPPDTAYAELVSIRAEDVIKGGQDVSKVWVTITIRYVKPGRQATAQVQDSSGNIYIIEAVENISPARKKYQKLTCLLIGTNV